MGIRYFCIGFPEFWLLFVFFSFLMISTCYLCQRRMKLAGLNAAIEKKNGKYHELLNSEDHLRHLKQYRKDSSYSRPDITHQVYVLSASDLARNMLSPDGLLQLPPDYSSVIKQNESSSYVKLTFVDPLPGGQLQLPPDYNSVIKQNESSSYM
ncbi:uncharacterized protein LOC129217464 isoform X2 [Uloborus diversus]|uniref:uncharacterized protein LOC129217464 isoform X2 n=1 Tax=Uloborus diversus TaxID=327109 RepID=UPI002409277B|nr:uncharacterized protein LOC129217464 isoform X2 [Uloborus diversus]